MPQFAEVVMPPHCPDLKDLLEFRETVKDLGEVPVLQTEHLHVIIVALLNRHVPILISQLEDKADVTKVASLVQCD